MILKSKKFFLEIFYVLLNFVWGILNNLLDFRTIYRFLRNKPLVDVVFISNLRDSFDRKMFLGKRTAREGHFNGPKYLFKNVLGRIRFINVSTNDLETKAGIDKAKTYFINAVKWAEKRGVKVILFAAGTKHLFGEEGKEITEMFPDIVFTIGDNGTALLLQEEVLRALHSAKIDKTYSRIAILGPYGLLGEQVVKKLKEKKYQKIVGVGKRVVALKEIAKKYDIEVCSDFSSLGEVDAIVACTHSKAVRLNARLIINEGKGRIRKIGRKLLVIDVAEPPNLIYEEYLKCADFVVRQDAGNAHSFYLKHFLDPLTYKMLRLSKGVTFGCFAEGLVIAEDILSKRKGKERSTDE